MLHSKLPIELSDDLTISVVRGRTRLSPDEALKFASDLIRKSTRRLILDEQADIAREQARG